MKKIQILKPILATSSVAIIVAPICACSKNISVDEVKFNQEYSYVETGSTRDFSQEVKILPENATDKSLTWKITDESGNNSSIATVDEKTGVVTGIGSGYAKLTCTSTSNVTKSSEQWIVVGKYVELTGFSIPQFSEATLKSTTTIKPTFVPENASTAKTQHIKWESSDTSIATIDEDTGEINTLSRGTTLITATPYDYNYQTQTIELKESLKSTSYLTVEYAPIEEFRSVPESISVKNQQGTKFKVVPEILPAGACQDYDVTITPTGVVHLADPTEQDKTIFEVTNTFVDPEACDIFFTSKYDSSKSAHCAVTVEDYIEVESIGIDDSSVPGSLVVGTEWTPTVTITPEKATYQKYYFESSDKNVADVSEDSPLKIKAIGEGTATITVHSYDGKHTDSCQLKVTAEAIIVESITLPQTAEVQKTTSIKLDPVISPKDATDKRVTWQSSDPNKVTVTDGTITGVDYTDTPVNITATAMDGSGKSATCQVSVTTEPITPITNIEIQGSAYVTGKGTTTDTIKVYNILPDEASYKVLSWEVEDSDVADIIIDPEDRSKVTVFGKQPGAETNVYALALDGSGVKSNPCHVKVGYDDPRSIEVNPKVDSIFVGDSIKLFATVRPLTAKQVYTWKSSDPDTLSINENGELVGVRPGKARIICRHAERDTVFTYFDVNVTMPPKHVTKIIITKESLEIKCGHPGALPVVQYEPQETTEKEVTWSVSDSSIASIDTKNNKIIALKQGETTLTATSVYDTSLTATCKIVVPEPLPESVKITDSPEVLWRGDKATIKAKIFPEQSVQPVRYETSDSSIISIDETSGYNCTVKARGIGTATIRCYVYAYPEIYDEVSISVYGGHDSFVTDSWETVCEVASKGIDEVHKYYALDCESNPQFKGTLIGYQRSIMLNGVKHQVRVIDENHDDLTSGGKAALTFELTGVMCDQEKNPITLSWSTGNWGYNNSSLQHSLNGGSKSELSTPCVKLLRDGNPEIGYNLKEVRKTTAWDGPDKWILQKYNCLLFPLTAYEMNSPKDLNEGTTYRYYQSISGTSDEKIKRDLNNKVQPYWTASAYESELDYAWSINTSGAISKSEMTYCKYGVSFAFCI